MKIIGRIFLLATIVVIWLSIVTRLHGTVQTAGLLQPSDFTPVLNAAGQPCYYDIQTNGQNTTYSQGLTARHVNGDLRFLVQQLGRQLHELSLTGKQCGDLIDTPTNRWDLSVTNLLYDFNGYWFEEANNRLWVVGAVDYTASNYDVEIKTLTLNADGTYSNLHLVTLAGFPMKRVYGGCQPIPPPVAAALGPFYKYICGWGGYTSLVNQGGGASMGLVIVAIPDPADYPHNTALNATQYKVITDHSGTGPTDWYLNGAPTSFDRSARLDNPINYYDGGDPRMNPSTPPTIPPVSSAQWLSPSPDGKGRFVWGDSYYNTGNWIDGVRSAFVTVASLCGGKCYYMNSTLNSDRRLGELHIYDPATLAQAATGGIPPWKVQPASYKALDLLGVGPCGTSGDSPPGNPAGTVYDPITHRLWIIAFCVNTYFSRLYPFDVNVGGMPPPADSDGDGVPDSADICPGTPSGTPVDVTGCPIPAPPASAPLTVVVSGPGTVTSSPAGISCPPTCAQSFPIGTALSLTATAGANASFSDWSAPCSGTTTCTLTLTVAMTVIATFVAVIPPPAGAVIVTAKTCTVVVTDSPPDGLGGWRAQFTRDGGAFGSADNSAPYTRSGTVNAGTYQMGVMWTKTGQSLVTRVLGSAVCQVPSQ